MAAGFLIAAIILFAIAVLLDDAAGHTRPMEVTWVDVVVGMLVATSMLLMLAVMWWSALPR